MSLNIVLDSDIVLDLLNLSQNDTQYAFSRLQKSPTQFWIPCCLLAILETQILPTRHHPLDKIVPQVKLLSCLAEHWHLIPPLHKNKIQALISLDAAVNRYWGWLTTTRFVKHPIEHGMAPKIFWGPNGPGAVF